MGTRGWACTPAGLGALPRTNANPGRSIFSCKLWNNDAIDFPERKFCSILQKKCLETICQDPNVKNQNQNYKHTFSLFILPPPLSFSLSLFLCTISFSIFPWSFSLSLLYISINKTKKRHHICNFVDGANLKSSRGGRSEWQDKAVSPDCRHRYESLHPAAL